MSRQGSWLVAYDIASPRRLARLRRWLVGFAVPIQYSVFVFTGGPGELAGLLAGLAERIDPRRDDVRLYPLERGRPVHVLGQPVLADGIVAATLEPPRRPRAACQARPALPQ